MKTKKMMLFVMLFGLTLNTFAQGFGFLGTYNSAKFKIVSDGVELPKEDFIHYNSLTGLGLEINYDYELSDNLYGEFGISYQNKGMIKLIEDEGYDGKDLTYESQISYLQIPLHLKYTFEVSDDTYIFGYGGLDIGFALSGKSKRDDGKNVNESEIKIGSSNNDDIKSSDFGFTLGAGVLYKSIEFRLGISNGLSDITPPEDFEVYNRVFFFGVGYRFNN